MSKVDPTQAYGLIAASPRWHPDFEKFPVTRAEYMREPYIRVTHNAVSVDGKAIGWTYEHVHFKWQDGDFKMHTRWVPASWVKRISRDESSWQDPYDMRDEVD